MKKEGYNEKNRINSGTDHVGHHKTNKMKIDDKFVKVGASFIQQETFPDNTEGGNEKSRCYLSDVFLIKFVILDKLLLLVYN